MIKTTFREALALIAYADELIEEYIPDPDDGHRLALRGHLCDAIIRLGYGPTDNAAEIARAIIADVAGECPERLVSIRVTVPADANGHNGQAGELLARALAGAAADATGIARKRSRESEWHRVAAGLVRAVAAGIVEYAPHLAETGELGEAVRLVASAAQTTVRPDVGS